MTGKEPTVTTSVVTIWKISRAWQVRRSTGPAALQIHNSWVPQQVCTVLRCHSTNAITPWGKDAVSTNVLKNSLIPFWQRWVKQIFFKKQRGFQFEFNLGGEIQYRIFTVCSITVCGDMYCTIYKHLQQNNISDIVLSVCCVAVTVLSLCCMVKLAVKSRMNAILTGLICMEVVPLIQLKVRLISIHTRQLTISSFIHIKSVILYKG